MLTLHALALTLFKIFLASYFISHGLNLSHNLDSALPLLNNSLASIPGFSAKVGTQALQIYAHLEVVIGVVIVMGWQSGRLLGLIVYLINSSLLASATDRIIIGTYLNMQD